MSEKSRQNRVPMIVAGLITGAVLSGVFLAAAVYWKQSSARLTEELATARAEIQLRDELAAAKAEIQRLMIEQEEQDYVAGRNAMSPPLVGNFFVRQDAETWNMMKDVKDADHADDAVTDDLLPGSPYRLDYEQTANLIAAWTAANARTEAYEARRALERENMEGMRQTIDQAIARVRAIHDREAAAKRDPPD